MNLSFPSVLTCARLLTMLAAMSPLPSTRSGPSRWYLKIDGRSVYGPVELDALIDWASQGRIGPGDEIATDRRSWVRADTLDELQLDWIVQLPDGASYGPVHRSALKDLVSSGRLQAGARASNRRTGEATTIRDVLAGPGPALPLTERLPLPEPALKGEMESLRRAHEALREAARTREGEWRGEVDTLRRQLEDARQLLESRETEWQKERRVVLTAREQATRQEEDTRMRLVAAEAEQERLRVTIEQLRREADIQRPLSERALAEALAKEQALRAEKAGLTARIEQTDAARLRAEAEVAELKATIHDHERAILDSAREEPAGAVDIAGVKNRLDQSRRHLDGERARHRAQEEQLARDLLLAREDLARERDAAAALKDSAQRAEAELAKVRTDGARGREGLIAREQDLLSRLRQAEGKGGRIEALAREREKEWAQKVDRLDALLDAAGALQRQWQEKAESAEGRCRQLQGECEGLRKAAAAIEQEVSALRRSEQERQRTVALLREREAQWTAERAQWQEQSAVWQQREKEFQLRGVAFEQERAASRSEMERATRELAETATMLDRTRKEWEGERAAWNEKASGWQRRELQWQQRVDAAGEENRAARLRIEDATRESADARAQLERLRSDAERERSDLSARMQESTQQLAASAADRRRLEEDLALQRSREEQSRQQMERRLVAATREVEELRKQRSSLEQADRTRTAELETVRREAFRLQSEKARTDKDVRERGALQQQLQTLAGQLEAERAEGERLRKELEDLRAMAHNTASSAGNQAVLEVEPEVVAGTGRAGEGRGAAGPERGASFKGIRHPAAPGDHKGGNDLLRDLERQAQAELQAWRRFQRNPGKKEK